MDLFRKFPEFTKAAVAFVAMFASFPVTLFVLPIFMIAGMEVRPWDMGMILAVGALCTFVTSPVGGRLADRFGAARVCTVGTSLAVTGFMSLLLIRVDSSPLWLLIPLILKGVGSALFFSPNNALLISSLPRERIGMASGMIGTLRQAGYALGLTLIASLFTALQDGVEIGWSREALGVIPPEAAITAARIFEEGGIWSPEMMLYIFRMSAIVCSGILILSLVNSLPRLRMNGRRQLMVVAAAAIAAIGGALVFDSASGVQVKTELVALGPAASADAPTAFGREARLPVPVAALVYATAEQAFADECAPCHGEAGRGITDLGVNLAASDFVATASDAEIAALIRNGRDTGNALNLTGVDMPAFDYLDTDAIAMIVAHLRRLDTR